jgi:rhamnosyl/mannosyltransferase
MQVTVLTTSLGLRSVAHDDAGVHVLKMGRVATVASTPLSPGLVAQFRHLRPDITHLHHPYPLAEVAYLMWGRRRMVMTYHSDIVRQRLLARAYRPVLKRVLMRANCIIASSPQYVASSSVLSTVADKCLVIPFGIDLGAFEAIEEQRVHAWRARLGHPLVLFVGRLRYYKGLEYLLEAMVSLPDVRLAVAGRGEMEKGWRAQAQSLGLSQRVHWLGDVSQADLPSLYAAADVFVLPASHRSEAFGLVQVEAMAAGVPVVSTDLGTGVSYVNLHGETGLVVPPGQSAPLARAIGVLLADSDLRQRMGGAGRARAHAIFNLDRMVSEVDAIYERVLGSA